MHVDVGSAGSITESFAASPQRTEDPLAHFLFPTYWDGVSEVSQEEILEQYTGQEQSLILERLDTLSTLVYLLGQDFSVVVELNPPGEGWHYDATQKIVKVDPSDLVAKTEDFLRFVMGHEGTHGRLTKLDVIPKDIWQQLGYPFMTQAIEDPRVNNFLADEYPYFQKFLHYVEHAAAELEWKMMEKAGDELGHLPRFMLAGFEYIRRWYADRVGWEREVSEALPDDVKDVIGKTLDAAERSWYHYPLKDECNRSDERARAYAVKSFEINRDEIWPEFKKLVEADLQNQEIEELLKMLRGAQGQEAGLPPDLEQELSPEELGELAEALANSEAKASQQEGGAKSPSAISLDDLSPELLEKLKQFLSKLPQDVQDAIKEQAEKELAKFEREMSEALQKMLASSVEAGTGEETDEGAEAEAESGDGTADKGNARRSAKNRSSSKQDIIDDPQHENWKRYRHVREGLRKEINDLEDRLKTILKHRRHRRWSSRFESGRSIDIGARISEVANDVSPVESRAWRRRERPSERDYAISLVVDLTGSMHDERIKETFKALVIVAETLTRLNIKIEILGFNSKLHVFKEFKEKLDNKVRTKMGGMEDEVHTTRSAYTDDGWALAQAAGRLGAQRSKHQFVILLTDGRSNPSPQHSQPEYELDNVVAQLRKLAKQVLIGIGIGRDTEVAKNYPNSIADIRLRDLPRKLSQLLEAIIRDEGSFRK